MAQGDTLTSVQNWLKDWTESKWIVACKYLKRKITFAKIKSDAVNIYILKKDNSNSDMWQMNYIQYRKHQQLHCF